MKKIDDKLYKDGGNASVLEITDNYIHQHFCGGKLIIEEIAKHIKELEKESKSTANWDNNQYDDIINIHNLIKKMV